MDAIDVHEKEQVSDEPDQQDDEWDGDVDLKVMADDYAKYLVVHSKKDVSFNSTLVARNDNLAPLSHGMVERPQMVCYRL